MKYLKTFEDEKWNDKEGSYVLLSINKENYDNFLNNNIGKITKVYYPGSWFDVEFDDIPEELERMFGKRNFHTNDIKHISKNREDLEAILLGRKYNIT